MQNKDQRKGLRAENCAWYHVMRKPDRRGVNLKSMESLSKFLHVG